jgi:hypothetical protein
MRKFISIAAAAGLLAISSSAAFADGGGATSLTVSSGGAISVTGGAPGNFTGYAIDGQPHSPTTGMGDLTATDYTGSGSGWNLQVTATQFSSTVPSARTLAKGSLDIGAPTATLLSNAGPDARSTSPSVFGATGIDTPGSTFKLASAAPDNGMGSYTLSFPLAALTLHVPATVYAGTYSSTVTVTIATGPAS